MISEGRYLYHLQDIAEIEAKPPHRTTIDKLRLESMRREVAEFEAAKPTEAAELRQRAKELAGR